MDEKKEYIEREAVLVRNMYGNAAPITHRIYAEGLISSAPAADVAPVVHGEWKDKEFGRGKYLSCSVCGWMRIGISIAEHYDYCPNCGAKMDGGKTNAK